MKKEIITKESLIVDIAKLRQSHEGWVSGDERRRKEFAKAFNWYYAKAYNNDKEPCVPSWEQIFVEIGKLLNASKFIDFENNVSELKHKFEDLEKKIITYEQADEL